MVPGTFIGHLVTQLRVQFKGTVSVISNDPLSKDCNARYITVTLKVLSN